ncbi:MAG: N-acetyltransferase [Nocardioidaceae bacterium]|nr:N-acetyltransferase [Nocardioidaceae bacterium]
MGVAVREAANGRRFEIYEDDELAGFAEVVPQGDALALPHTEIEPARGGRGLATELIRLTLETLRDRGQMVLPYCPFVASFIAKHPEFVPIVPADTRSQFGL